MGIWRSVTTLVILLLLVSTNALAQEKNELAGLIGRTFISDQSVTGVTSFDTKIRSGNGLSFEAAYGRRVLGGDGLLSVTLELPVMVNPDEDVHFSVNLVPANYRSFFFTPSARVNVFANSAFSPWVSLGGGFGHFSAASTLEFGGNNPGPASRTTGALQFGAGFDVKVFHSMVFRAEVRDFDTGRPPLNLATVSDRQHNLFVAGGIVFRF